MVRIFFLLLFLTSIGNKFRELDEVRVEGATDNMNFVKNRDNLEQKYLNIISEHIKREREHQKEVFKKHNSHALMSLRRNNDDRKNVENEDICDRTPILDILIEKWKYFNKQMKFMMEKYAKNASALRDAFEKITTYLGVESFDDIPDLLERLEEQMSSIEMYISKLNNEIFYLQDRKSLVEHQIKDLISRSSNNSNLKAKFSEKKKDRIDMLNLKINDNKLAVAQKEKFFQDFKEPTDGFLEKLENTFLSEYAPARIYVNKEEWYNEENIMTLLANVQDYLRIIEEVEKSLQVSSEKAKEKKNLEREISSNNQINSNLEKLKSDMKAKIDLLQISSNLQSNMKDKLNTSFDDAIKKMSEDIVKGTLNHSKVVGEGKKKNK